MQETTPKISPVILPVILCGGSGTRLWPLSRLHTPKPFLKLFSHHSLFQETILRLQKLHGTINPLIICNKLHHFLVGEQLAQIGVTPTAILLEPEGRNTGAAVATAIFWVIKNLNQVSILITPADNSIDDEQELQRAVSAATHSSLSKKLVLFGIKPEQQNENFGYIKTSGNTENGVASIEKFIEKPNEKSLKIIHKEISEKANLWFWNSGMFLFTPQLGLDALQQNAPELLAAQKAVYDAKYKLGAWLLGDSFLQLPRMAFDSCVVEKSTNTVVVALNSGWADLGTWNNLWHKKTKTVDGNVLQGKIITHQSKNCLLHCSKRLLTVMGVEDLIIIDSDDAILVAHKNHADYAYEFVKTNNHS